MQFANILDEFRKQPMASLATDPEKNVFRGPLGETRSITPNRCVHVGDFLTLSEVSSTMKVVYFS